MFLFFLFFRFIPRFEFLVLIDLEVDRFLFFDHLADDGNSNFRGAHIGVWCLFLLLAT